MANMDVNTVEQLVRKFEMDFKTEFLAQVESIEEEIAQLETDARGHTYDMVAGLVVLADAIDVSGQGDGVKQFIIGRSLIPARGSNNVFGPFVQAVFSERVNGKWTRHEKHKSLAKHANHVRYLLDKKRNGFITGTIQDYIKNHPEVNGHGGLRAIEAQDRIDNPSAAQAKRIDDTRRRGMNAMPIATIASPIAASDGDVVRLWGRISQGQVEIMGADVANDNTANSLWYKLGATIPASK